MREKREDLREKDNEAHPTQQYTRRPHNMRFSSAGLGHKENLSPTNININEACNCLHLYVCRVHAPYIKRRGNNTLRPRTEQCLGGNIRRSWEHRSAWFVAVAEPWRVVVGVEGAMVSL
eukprot:scaffold40318_cov47-Attheya_sp.AAC.1